MRYNEKEKYMVFSKVAEVLAEYKDMEASEIKLETTFEELELDSLDTVELVMALEEAFDVELEMDESIVNVAAVIAAVEKAQG